MNLRAKFFFIIITTLIAAGCGSPGEPLPPSLEIPRPATDLRAARKGNAVTLTWTAPTLTTEGRTITQSGNFEVCRSFAAMQRCETPVARIPFGKISKRNSASAQESYIDILSAAPSDPTANFHYAVDALNSYDKTAGLSNQVEIPAAPVLSPPTGLQAQVSAQGIHLTWQAVANAPQVPGLHFFYRVYRRESGTKAEVIAGELPVGDASPTLLDHSFEWEKTYDYWITVVTAITPTNGNGNEEQVEGDNSPPVQVVAHDIFPPATPTGLQAVFSGPGQKPLIDLIWTPNSEQDLAGYNVYRHEQGMPAAKINVELVKAPAFRDGTALACVTYFYSVSAVDVRGNESARSEEVQQGSTCEN